MFKCFLNVECKVLISVGMQYLIQLPAFSHKHYTVSEHALLNVKNIYIYESVFIYVFKMFKVF